MFFLAIFSLELIKESDLIRCIDFYAQTVIEGKAVLTFKRLFVLLFAFFVVVSSANTRQLDTQYHQLKSDYLRLLEHSHSSKRQDVDLIYFGFDENNHAQVSSLQVFLDGELIANNKYTPVHNSSFLKGGAQRLWGAPLSEGRHAVKAVVGVNGKTQAFEFSIKKKQGKPLIKLLAFQKKSDNRLLVVLESMD